MMGGGRWGVVAVVSWSFEPVQSLVRDPRDRGVSLRARTPDSESPLVSLQRPPLSSVEVADETDP
jgi:hypothetical protein